MKERNNSNRLKPASKARCLSECVDGMSSQTNLFAYSLNPWKSSDLAFTFKFSCSVGRIEGWRCRISGKERVETRLPVGNAETSVVGAEERR